MTINRVREILGEAVKDYSDNQILEIVQENSILCDVLMDIFDREILTEKLKSNKTSIKNG